MQAKDPRRGIPSEWLTFEPVSIVPGLRMLVQIFPYDRRLRTLGPMIGAVGRDVDPLLLARIGPGEWEVEDRTIETARYRTERGAVLRYSIRARDVQSDRRETLASYLKVYRNERGAETWQFLRLMSEKAGGGPQPYDVIRPIAYLSEHRTLVMEEAPGDPLTQLLLRAGDPAEAVRPVARAFAAAAAFVEEYFRHAPSSWRKRLPLHSAAAFLEVAAGIFRAQEPGWRETLAWIIEAAQRACEEVPD